VSAEPQRSIVARIAGRRGVQQFFKFAIVGFSGLLVNFVVFTVLQQIVSPADRGHYYNALYSIGFLSGGVSNYVLNRAWTFREHASSDAFKQGAKFLGVSILALAVGLVVSAIAKPYFGPGHRTWFLANVSGIAVNFFVNKYWTFRAAP
jgi:putative flippase GtrA